MVYYTIEVIGLAGLCAVEGLRVGWRHSMLALPFLAYAPLIRLLPELRVMLYNLLLMGTSVAAVYLHMRQPVPEAGPRDSEEQLPHRNGWLGDVTSPPPV